MAQIGTPSAGWYTDPSGQHLARYWDGASWTEQVRDDLNDPAAPTTTAAPTAASGNSTNPVADTVAGVAEAVAAVAANDVGWPGAPGSGAPTAVPPMAGMPTADPSMSGIPTAEPPLVVDYGTDTPWGGLPTDVGSLGPVADPFAAAASEPAFDAIATATEPMASSAPVVTPAPTPVATGPAPGWYPDPAARHQARLWDGTGWTERVADNGVEGLDPLPGAPAASTGTVDPAVGAWSSELADTAAATVGPDGQTMSAGQISLASLPATEEPEAVPNKPAPVRPTVKVRIGGGFVLGGAVALLLGSTMTWMEVTGPRVGDEWTSSGLDLGDGRITVALAVVLAVLGVAIITGRMTRFGGTKVAAMGSLVAGAAALAVTAVDIADVADRASRLGVPAGAVSNVGTGLWLAFVGALFAVGGGLLAFANRQ